MTGRNISEFEKEIYGVADVYQPQRTKCRVVKYMYASVLILAVLVFAATYFHRQVGLITLLLVGLFCAGILAPNVSDQNYTGESGFFGRITFALSIILFFAAILLKRFLKKKKKRG